MLKQNKTSFFVLSVSAFVCSIKPATRETAFSGTQGEGTKQMQSNQTSVRLKCLLLTMLTFAVALGLVKQAHAFTFITINNADGFPGFMAEGINGSGDIVGSSVGEGGDNALCGTPRAPTSAQRPGCGHL